MTFDIQVTNFQIHASLFFQLADRVRELDRLYLAIETARQRWHQAPEAGHPYDLYQDYLRAKAAHAALRDSPLPDGEEAEVP